jgi:hypothetical protein
LPSMHEALNHIPSTAKEKEKEQSMEYQWLDTPEGFLFWTCPHRVSSNLLITVQVFIPFAVVNCDPVYLFIYPLLGPVVFLSPHFSDRSNKSYWFF